MFWQGMEFLKNKYPDSQMDLLVQPANAEEFPEPFKKAYLLSRPFFSLFSLAPNTWVNLMKERYDLIVLFYNSSSGALYEPVKRMSFSLFAKKIIAVYPDGRMKEIRLGEIISGMIQIQKNVWLDGIVAGGMVLALYLVCGVLGLIKKPFGRG